MLYSNPFEAAHENLEKNRGSSEQWFTHNSQTVVTPTAKLRVRFDAIEIAERNNQNVSMAALAGFIDRPNVSKDQQPQDERSRPDCRLRTKEAREIAVKFRDQVEKWHDFEGNMNYRPPPKPPRMGTGEDAEEIFKNMHKKPDWFQHSSAPDQSSEKRSMRTDSAYAMRNRQQDWFCHRSARELRQQPSQPVHSRIRPDGEEYAERNRGTTDLLHMKRDPSEPGPNGTYGCPTSEARSNAFWGRTGVHMASVFGNPRDLSALGSDEAEELQNHAAQAVMRPRTAKVRGSEAHEWQLRGKDGCLGQSMFCRPQEAQSEIRPNTHHRVRLEAQDYQTKSKSGDQLRNCLQMTVSSRALDADEATSNQPPRPRLRSEEAFDAMRRNKGDMSSYLGNGATSVTMPCRRKVQPRGLTSSEGQEAALRSKGCATKQLLSNDRLSPEPFRKSFANLPEEIREMAQQSRQGQVCHLLGGRSSQVPLAGNEAPAPRRLHFEALEYADKQRGGEMNAILNHG